MGGFDGFAVRDWGEHPDELASAFAEDPHSPATMSVSEVARLSEADPLADAPDHIRADVPEWTAPLLNESLGENWIAEGQAMAARSPLDLRVNTLKSTREKVLKSLSRFGPEAAALTPEGIRIAAEAIP